MFELSVAFKYLRPRWRQLSVSIISMISILVIALVVWLIVVFFSVTHGLEKSWIQKLIALTAPIRISPTEEYYNSHYYLIDSISSASDYTLKSIGEKLYAPDTNPYDPQLDEEPPSYWKSVDLEADGSSMKDLVKKAFQTIAITSKRNSLTAKDFETTVSNLRLRLTREQIAITDSKEETKGIRNQATLSQSTYLGSFDPNNATLAKALLPLTMKDVNNALDMLATTSDNDSKEVQEMGFSLHENLEENVVRARLHAFFTSIALEELTTPARGWTLPRALLPNAATFQAYAIGKEQQITQIYLPNQQKDLPALKKQLELKGNTVQLVEMHIGAGKVDILWEEKILPLSRQVPIILAANTILPVKIIEASIDRAQQASDVQFAVAFIIQGIEIHGTIPYRGLRIHKAEVRSTYAEIPQEKPFWLYQVVQQGEPTQMILPSDPYAGDGILLPKSFKDSGALLGDRGHLSYFTPTTSSVQEQRLPIYVAGFYDPGIIPIGGKYIVANQEITSLIRASHNQEDTALSNGINIRFDNLEQADAIKAELQQAFVKAGIDKYWNIETYREFTFTRDIMQQLHSEKNLWRLIAMVIIIVACSNIISMLIILVNDKKLEIGILRSMGASSASIAAIFGVCGMIMGLLGSVIGTVVAVITLRNLQFLVNLIGQIQGYDMFNPVFYGTMLPNEVSYEALAFVIAATSLISLLAGIVPAMKASLLRPSTILRSE